MCAEIHHLSIILSSILTQGGAYYYDPRWDAGECRVQQHSCRYHHDGQLKVAQGCETSDVLPWDTGGRGEVGVNYDQQVDQLCKEDELPQCEVPIEVDVLIPQVPPPMDKGEHREQENDVSSFQSGRGRGLSQKSSSQHCQNADFSSGPKPK